MCARCIDHAQVEEARRRRTTLNRKLLSHEARASVSDVWAVVIDELVFDDHAIAEIENIYDWIAQGSPANAKAVAERLFSRLELLISFPHGACRA